MLRVLRAISGHWRSQSLVFEMIMSGAGFTGPFRAMHNEIYDLGNT